MVVPGGHATPTDDPTGIDVAAVTDWLVRHADELAAPFRWARLPGGHSNFTYRVVDAADRAFVVRRPPMGELLASAHDMGREYRVISALWPTPVPVARPIAFCDDPDVTGAPFYAMGEVVGRSLYRDTDVEAVVPLDRRVELGHSFFDVLADLHALDPDEIGLGDLGKPHGYVARQLRRWKASWDASHTVDRPEVARVHDVLVERLPEQRHVSVVHGDYGLHNCIVDETGTVQAVIDWEISTLGDPLADLAYAVNFWGRPGSDEPVRPGGPTSAPGFRDPDELIERYAARTGRDVSDLDVYLAFNHWKTVCIIDGVLARYLHGQKSSEGIDLDALALSRDRSLELAVELVDG